MNSNNPEKETESKNNSSTLGKIKTIVTGAAGAGAVGAGIATANPILVMGGATAFFSSIVSPVLAQRQEKFLQSLKNDFELLEKQVSDFDIKKMLTDEKMVTVLIQANQIAIRTHQEKKLEMLKNAVLNISINDSPGEDTQLMMLQYVDELTPTHMRILSFLHDPREWEEQHEGDDYDFTKKFARNFESDRIDIISRRGYPVLAGLERFSGDLVNRGLLINLNNLQTEFASDYLHHPWDKRWTSSMAKQFLTYIKSPTQDDV